MLRTTLASALTALFCTFGPAAAQDADWEVTCNDKSCTITRTLTENTTGRRVATFMTVVEKGRTDAPGLGVAVPLGLAVEPGVRLVSGADIIELPFQVCFPDGCRAIRAATTEEISLLSSVDKADIRFFPFGQDHPTSVAVPMTGFGDALADAKAKLGGN